ncbi:hypothetical protein D3C76_1287110 [compost metagenome]
MPEGIVAGGGGRVRPDERRHGGDQQDDAADRLDVQEALQGGECALGDSLGTGHYMFLHGRKDSRKAARPA